MGCVFIFPLHCPVVVVVLWVRSMDMYFKYLGMSFNISSESDMVGVAMASVLDMHSSIHPRLPRHISYSGLPVVITGLVGISCFPVWGIGW